MFMLSNFLNIIVNGYSNALWTGFAFGNPNIVGPNSLIIDYVIVLGQKYLYISEETDDVLFQGS